MTTTTALLDDAQAGDEHAFLALIGPHRRAIEVHCYRMLGSIEDAEDTVQEVLVRAWRALGRFERRASLGTWLYRIATNACLDELDRRPHRPLPTVDPYPEERLAEVADEPLADPAARYAQREGMELALLTAIQRLPGRQRAVLILRDVLGWTAPETADLLDTTTAAVNSALQRARSTIDEQRPAHSPRAAGPRDAALLRRYIEAWQSGDVDGLIALLRDDATAIMPPRPDLLGARAIAEFFGTMDMSHQVLTATAANHQPAIAVRTHNPDGSHEAHRLLVLDVDADGDRVAALRVYFEAGVLERCGV
jgi:RNA polymerase sigma-70 factor, ECF subfamily